MGRKDKSDLPKWLRSKSLGEKSFKNIHAAGRVFMLEFRVSYPTDIPRAHLALLFDISGSCITGNDGHMRLIAGTIAHIVVNDIKTRETKLEIRHVSSSDHNRFLDPASINRVYLLGKLNNHPMNHPKNFFDFVVSELEELYQSLVEAEESVSEGEVALVRRSEYEEKRYYGPPRKRTHSRQPTPSISLTESGSIIWKVSDLKGDELWYTKDEVKSKPKTLKDSTQSIILTYGPSQRDEIRKSGIPMPIVGSDSPTIGGNDAEIELNVSTEFEAQGASPSDFNHFHGPYWDNKLNCLTFCKAVVHHWPELSWPSEGLCAPILWPLPSLNIHMTMGYPMPSPANSSSHSYQMIDTGISKHAQPYSTKQKPGTISRFLSSLKRHIKSLWRKMH